MINIISTYIEACLYYLILVLPEFLESLRPSDGDSDIFASSLDNWVVEEWASIPGPACQRLDQA